ncbi:MAG: hypothetical protein WCV83_00820 [Candidatus Magasanikbacteria bacterium]
MARKDKDLKEVLGNWTIGFEALSALVYAILKKGGGIEDLSRLSDKEDTTVVDQVADLLVRPKVVAEQLVVPPPPPKPVALRIEDFVTPMKDDQVPTILLVFVSIWRMIANWLGYTGPIAWRIREGFTLKTIAPQVGPCRKDFQYLQNWNFPDEPTKDCIVFWIPRLVVGSTSKSVSEQMKLLADLRKQFNLPEHHLSGFGSVTVLAALILAHHKLTGEMVPLGGNWTRTDTCGSGGGRLGLGWVGGALCCGVWSWDGVRYGSVGAFPLGVELEH